MATVPYKKGFTASVFSIPDGLYIGDIGLSGQIQLVNDTNLVSASRSLTVADNGLILECAENVNITVPAGLPQGFRCKLIPNGTHDIISSGGTLLNGATTTVVRTSAANQTFEIIGRVSATNSYVVTGTAPA